MAFVRNSITYNMIFYLQGPQGKNPLDAGIGLIPYGIGIMTSGFTSGALADKVGVKTLITIGPLVTLAAAALLANMDQNTSKAAVGGLIFFAGFGVGLVNSPNSMANMLSVVPERRGVAAAIGMLTMTFCMMVGIVLTFSFVLHSMSSKQLFDLFIYGGSSLEESIVRKCLDALAMDYYSVIIACGLASFTAMFIPNDFQKQNEMNRLKEIKVRS